MAGKTGQEIFLGKMDLLTEETPRDEVTSAYDDLIVARNGGKYDGGDFEYAEEPDGDGIWQWQWKAQTIHTLNVKMQNIDMHVV